MSAPRHCFLSYAHYDVAAFGRLTAHLRPVMHLFGIAMWDDGGIRAGANWDEAIRAKIEQSDIFILLTTNDFLGSEYVLNTELPSIIRRHRDHAALVLPIVLRTCGWEAFFGRYIQALPHDPKLKRLHPIANWHRPEDGFAQAAHGVAESIKDWFGIEPRSPFDVLGRRAS